MSSSSKLKNRRESWFVPPTGKRNSMPNRTDTCREEVGKRRRARSDGSEPKWGQRWSCPCLVLAGLWECARLTLQTLVFLLRYILYVLTLSIIEET